MKRVYPEHVPREGEGDSTILSSHTEHTGGAPEAPSDRETHAEPPIAKPVPTAQLTGNDTEHDPPMPPQGSESLNTRNDAIPAPPRIEFEDLGPIAPVGQREKEHLRHYNADGASGIPSGRPLMSQLQKPVEPETMPTHSRLAVDESSHLERQIVTHVTTIPLSDRGQTNVSSNPRRVNQPPQQPMPASTSVRAVHPQSGSLIALAQHDQVAGNGQRLPRSDGGLKLRINRLDIQIINQTPNQPPQRRAPSQPPATTPDLQEAFTRRYMERIW
ncbi:MAG: hypothetical protein ISS70_18335 [Phycisphaerae bacterium]|nr:hypothetical protein [Phycisphaerae bacterium]